LLSLLTDNDLAGQEVLITAGPTREPLDPARYLSNRSSGKMGYGLARIARRRGANVTLISGPVNLEPPPGVNVVQVVTAQEMLQTVREHATTASVIIKAAAVADFRPVVVSEQKIKKADADLRLELTKNQDILAELGKTRQENQVLVGFAAESSNHEAEGTRKLRDKHVDLMVVNDIMGEQTGFEVDTNQVTLISPDNVTHLPLMSKEETASGILDRVASLLKK
jgi:phosphopantothenoylcysteine decarboxylase/phosphopantothenate--cysteine ligase